MNGPLIPPFAPNQTAEMINPKSFPRLMTVGALLVLLGGELPPPSKKKIDFERDIEPIFEKNCIMCHGPDRQRGDLRFDEKESAMKGNENGPVIKPGKSADSLLIQLVAEVEKGEVMPPEGKKLTKEQIGMLRAWTDQGAKWPE